MIIPFAVQSYTSESLPWSAQRCVNFYAEAAPPGAATKSPVAVFGRPGIAAFSTAGNGPVRGMWVMRNVLYAVSGDRLYSVDGVGTATDLGAIGGTERVGMADNGVQLCIVNGSKGYIYTLAGGLVNITDPDFPGANSVTFQDGYFIFTRSGSGQFFISAINDGTSYDALDFATAEGAPDDTVREISDHRELWLFGEHSTEIWYNSGNADFPFERNPGAYVERGCGARWSVVKMDNSVFWLGDDGKVYRATDRAPQRISTDAVDGAIRDYGAVSDAFGLTVDWGGHKWYVLTFPSGDATWVFDVATGLWHELSSGVADGRWRVNAHAYCYGRHLVGDLTTGKIGALSASTFDEWGDVLRGVLTSPPIHADGKRMFMTSLELDFETGVGLAAGQGSDPLVVLDWSDDGGRTWCVTKPMRSLGKIGEYRTRVRWTRMGSFRSRIYRVTITDPVARRLLAARAELTVGAH